MDDFTGTWTVTSDESGNITGQLQTNPPGCPTITYSVTATITPIQGNANVDGAADIYLYASGPAPFSNCSDGSQPATYAEIRGTVANDGCDLVPYSDFAVLTTNFGSWSTHFSKPPDIPSGESVFFQGFGSGDYSTIGQWRQRLSTDLNMDGRQVHEGIVSGLDYDSCYFDGSAVGPALLSGGYWNVGFFFTNNWDDDYVGWTTGAVTYYRQTFRPPCSAQVPQGMYIATQGTSASTLYTSGWVGESIPDYATAASARDGNVSYTAWP